MKIKVPYGALAGVCGVLAFYLTAAVVASFQVLDRIEAETNNHASLFGNWWQTLLFVADILFACGMIAFIVLAVIGRKRSTARISAAVAQQKEVANGEAVIESAE